MDKYDKTHYFFPVEGIPGRISPLSSLPFRPLRRTKQQSSKPHAKERRSRQKIPIKARCTAPGMLASNLFYPL
jgi:hypothetical protein